MHAVKNQKIFSRLNEEQLVLLQQAMREHQVRLKLIYIYIYIYVCIYVYIYMYICI